MPRIVRFVVLVTGFSLLVAAPAHASLLYITPPEAAIRPGDTFTAEVRVTPEGGECINAVDAVVAYPTDVIQVSDISTGESIFPLWVKYPVVDRDAGTVSFTGGLPGGYCGRIPGDPGVTNILVKIIFKVPGFRVGENLKDFAEVKFRDESQVLRSDGQGTASKVTIVGATYRVAMSGDVVSGTWQKDLKDDAIPPEPFTVAFVEQRELFGGKYAIVFSTSDKQTGIDRYEVLEADAQGNVPGYTMPAIWKSAQSPYVLNDQALHSIITVKAVDKNQNERTFTLTPPGFTALEPQKAPAAGSYAGLIFLAIVVIVVWVVVMAVRRRRRRVVSAQYSDSSS